MKEHVNMTLAKQFRSVLLGHLYLAFLTAAFGLGAFWWFLVQDKWSQLFSIICMGVYFCVLYSKGAKIAVHDRKGYVNQTPYALKGAVLALGICVVTVILWAFYRLAWVYMTIDGSISGYTGLFYNLVFTIWTFPFNGIICLYRGGMFWYGHIIIYALPVISVGLGYFAGYKNFSIYEKWLAFMYENKKKE